MENASKALIIAGAILLAILLIGIGMMILNAIGGVTDEAENIGDQQTAQLFNRPWEQYTGRPQTAAQVRQLINAVNAHNSRPNVRLVNLDGGAVSGGPAPGIFTFSGSTQGAARFNVEVDQLNAGFISRLTVEQN